MRRGGGGRSRPVRWGRWARARVVLVVTALVATVGVVGAEPAAAAHAAAEVRWLQVSAGTNHTCAIRERSPGAGEGTLWCWGSNAAGRLGTGDTIARSVPTQIGKETNWFFVSVGNSHSCALRTQVLGIGGVRYCWGDNIHYKLGKGPHTPDEYKPKMTDTGFSSLSAGYSHTCGIGLSLAIISCWGENHYNELGVPGGGIRHSPVKVRGGRALWKQVSAGTNYTCAIGDDDKRYCWGSDHALSRKVYRLGFGDLFPSTALSSGTGVPTTINDGKYMWLTTGSLHACGISVNHRGYCWGRNEYGQLGLGDYNVGPDGCCMKTPEIRLPITSWNRLHAGFGFTCGLTTKGARLCWGRNSSGQLGLGDFNNRYSPEERMNTLLKQPAEGEVWEQLSVGYEHACGIRKSGELYCWGENFSGQLGIGDHIKRNIPVRVVV